MRLVINLAFEGIAQNGDTWSVMSGFGQSPYEYGDVTANIDLTELYPMGGAPVLTDPQSLTYPVIARASFNGGYRI